MRRADTGQGVLACNGQCDAHGGHWGKVRPIEIMNGPLRDVFRLHYCERAIEIDCANGHEIYVGGDTRRIVTAEPEYPVREHAANRYKKPRRVHAWSSEEAPGWPEGYRMLRPACGKVVPLVRHESCGLSPETPVTCRGCRAALAALDATPNTGVLG
jgi:hypothetical protein